MQELDKIGEDLFNKIRGRFPQITIGNENGEVINEPSQARFFDFDFKCPPLSNTDVLYKRAKSFAALNMFFSSTE